MLVLIPIVLFGVSVVNVSMHLIGSKIKLRRNKLLLATIVFIPLTIADVEFGNINALSTSSYIASLLGQIAGYALLNIGLGGIFIYPSLLAEKRITIISAICNFIIITTVTIIATSMAAMEATLPESTHSATENILRDITEELKERENAKAKLNALEKQIKALPEGINAFVVNEGLLKITTPDGYIRDDAMDEGMARTENSYNIKPNQMKFGKNIDIESPRAQFHEGLGGRSYEFCAKVSYVNKTHQDYIQRLHEITVDSGKGWQKIDDSRQQWVFGPFSAMDTTFGYGITTKYNYGKEVITHTVNAEIWFSDYILEISIWHGSDTTSTQMGQMTVDIVNWRDAILAANND